MKIYIATNKASFIKWLQEQPDVKGWVTTTVYDFNNEERCCFLSEKEALESIEEEGVEGYVVECEIKGIKATFPPKEKGKLYPVKIDLK